MVGLFFLSYKGDDQKCIDRLILIDLAIRVLSLRAMIAKTGIYYVIQIAQNM